MDNLKTWGESRSTRLKNFDYSSPNVIYYLTICSKDNKEILTINNNPKAIIGSLKKSSELSGYRIMCYCILPDHMHFILHSGKNPKALPVFVNQYKAAVSRVLGRSIWQTGYYEHIKRQSENLKDAVKYILNNPVRNGLVDNSDEWKWSYVASPLYK